MKCVTSNPKTTQTHVFGCCYADWFNVLMSPIFTLLGKTNYECHTYSCLSHNKGNHCLQESFSMNGQQTISDNSDFDSEYQTILKFYCTLLIFRDFSNPSWSLVFHQRAVFIQIMGLSFDSIAVSPPGIMECIVDIKADSIEHNHQQISVYKPNPLKSPSDHPVPPLSIQLLPHKHLSCQQRLSKQTTSPNIDLSYYPSQTDNDIISSRCSARDTPQGFVLLQVCHGPALIKLLRSMSGMSNRECCAPRYTHNDSLYNSTRVQRLRLPHKIYTENS